MGTRILVTSKFDRMPGEGENKITWMANKCCQELWARDFNKSIDRFYCEGDYNHGHRRCYLLIDVGPVEDEYKILWYQWKDNTLYLFLHSLFLNA